MVDTVQWIEIGPMYFCVECCRVCGAYRTMEQNDKYNPTASKKAAAAVIMSPPPDAVIEPPVMPPFVLVVALKVPIPKEMSALIIISAGVTAPPVGVAPASPAERTTLIPALAVKRISLLIVISSILVTHRKQKMILLQRSEITKHQSQFLTSS